MGNKKYKNPCMLRRQNEGRDGNPCLIRKMSFPLVFSWERPPERKSHPEIEHNPCAPRTRKGKK